MKPVTIICYGLIYLHMLELLLIPALILPVCKRTLREHKMCRHILRRHWMYLHFAAKALVFSVLSCIVACIRMALTESEKSQQYILLILGTFLYIAFLACAYEGTVRRKAVCFVWMTALENIADLSVYVFVTAVLNIRVDLLYRGDLMWIPLALFLALYMLLCMIFVTVWRRRTVPLESGSVKAADSYSWLKYGMVVVIYFVTQIVTIILQSGDLFFKEIDAGARDILKLAFLLAADVLLLYMLSDFILETRRRQRLKAMELDWKREVLRYRNLAGHTEGLAKLRHDYQNYLETVYCLLENGQGDELLGNLKKVLEVQKNDDFLV